METSLNQMCVGRIYYRTWMVLLISASWPCRRNVIITQNARTASHTNVWAGQEPLGREQNAYDLSHHHKIQIERVQNRHGIFHSQFDKSQGTDRWMQHDKHIRTINSLIQIEQKKSNSKFPMIHTFTLANILKAIKQKQRVILSPRIVLIISTTYPRNFQVILTSLMLSDIDGVRLSYNRLLLAGTSSSHAVARLPAYNQPL